MATFGYEVLDKTGKTLKGSIDAETIEKAKSDLKSKGYTLLAIKEQGVLSKDIDLNIGGYPTPRDLAVFCRQFTSMIRAGVTMLDCLKMLADATENKRLKEAIKGVRVSTEKGEGFATSLKKYPKIFPQLMVNMVEAGEASGSLDISMERMSTQFERSSKTKSLVKKAMMYPCVLCVVALLVTVIMLVVVLPNYANMFAEMGTELPGITKAVMAVSDFIIANYFILIPAIAVTVFGITTFLKTDLGKHVAGKLVLSIPATRELISKTAAAQMARTLSTLIGSGVPLTEAVAIVAGIMDNVYFKEALEEAANDITIGQPLSKPLEECGLFPPMVYHMVRIGEETGNTEEMLNKLADYYEEEVEMAVQTVMAAMEPMIIVVMAGIVGTLVGACMAPMLKMYETLGSL